VAIVLCSVPPEGLARARQVVKDSVAWGTRNDLTKTLQETNISHHGKREITFKSALGWDMLVPSRVVNHKLL